MPLAREIDRNGEFVVQAIEMSAARQGYLDLHARTQALLTGAFQFRVRDRWRVEILSEGNRLADRVIGVRHIEIRNGRATIVKDRSP